MVLAPEQIKKFERELLLEKQKLEKELEAIAAKDPALKGDFDANFPSYGKEDIGDTDQLQDAIEEFDAVLGIENTLELRLQEVSKALEAIKNGTYGFCENCKEEIPKERLEANPAAMTCVKCQVKK